jgi:hypothetical protein
MERVSTVPTVAVDLFRGLLTVIFLGVCAFSILIIVVVIVANYSSEAREQAKWCTEYMPEASRSECAAEAGW